MDKHPFLEMNCLYEFTWYSGAKWIMYLISFSKSHKYPFDCVCLTYLCKNGIREMNFYLDDGYAGDSKRWKKINIRS